MLSELYIRDFAIIDELRLNITNGFNVVTGETGAGKSIILDAVTLLIGGRADKSMVRADCERALIEGTYQVATVIQADVSAILAEESLDDEGEWLTIGRELRSNGRSIGRINGRTVSQTLLQRVGSLLVDIHGQGQHLSLLKPKAHLPLLDAYAGLDKEREAYAVIVSKVRELQRELASLQQDEQALAQRVDMLSFQIQEIDAAALTDGEDAKLVTERQQLSNAEALKAQATTAAALVVGNDDDESPAAVDMLNQAERALIQLAKLDESKQPLLEQLQGLAFQLSEAGTEIETYRDALEANPARLNAVEERLELISRLKRKYGTTIPDITAFREQAGQQLDGISNSEERIVELTEAIEVGLKRVGKAAAKLSKKRRKSAEKLAETVEAELSDLSMTARFAVDFQHEPDKNGAFVDDQRVAFDTTGVDQVEFLISANPGEPLKPMAKVASGGETARLMLALKTALAQVDATPTLIFDEIDQGIGGRIGEIVGRKLWGLSSDGSHQVIVVTHLPQLAGYGDAHFHVQKQVESGRTRTAVNELDFDARVEELAAMLGTRGDYAQGGARDLLVSAGRYKSHSPSKN